MPLGWNEIKDRALKFSQDWADACNEDSEAQPFLVNFFNVFGISQRKVYTFEHKVKKIDEREGYIDLLWKGVILIEMKSRGKDLDKAYRQASEYLEGLPQNELPKFVLVSDFDKFHLYDLDEGNKIEFKLKDLVNNVHYFGHLLGYQKKIYKEQDPANIKAAEVMGKLHDRLKEIGYTGHPLEVYLVRLLFCLFAEDTTIFEKQQFQEFIEQRTNIDGSDLAAKLQELFQVLNMPIEKRFKNLDEQLAVFPYVNGKLFEEILPIASFDSQMRQSLLDCCGIEWSKISPAIFGSMFQSVMNPSERRNLGAHYTSEKNILKLIKPLFLDDLWKEFQSIKVNKNKLIDFHKRLSTLKFLDPACGCGNFLVITYRELRLLELEVLRVLNKSDQRIIDVSSIIWLDVDRFYGIEYEEFPARIAEVAMWLIDHQMNQLVSLEFGQYFTRIPLRTSANIVCSNALQIDWNNVVPIEQLSFIIGNPPFVGHHYQTATQKSDQVRVMREIPANGVLDYVANWYIKASECIFANNKIEAALVSTSSITQGEQAGLLWPLLLAKHIRINFAHRTFQWSSEARGKAAVHCVIVGFALFDRPEKWLFEYEDIKGEPHVVKARNINPYLVDASDLIVGNRSTPICNVPKMSWGNKPTDGGHLILSPEEKQEFIAEEPATEKYIRRYLSGGDFIKNIERYCLWLVDAPPDELKKMRRVMKRVEAVRTTRLASKAANTRAYADHPTLFRQIAQPDSDYLAIPEVSSERRKYIPMAYLSKETICSNKIQFVPGATLYHFGVLQSIMHMAWMRTVCGRLESRYSYSNTIVYNNFPWPYLPTEKQMMAIETAAEKVLNVRLEFPHSSLADLYDPLTMPPDLIKAHTELDKAVDLAYRPQPFTSEANRVEFLFTLYEKYTAGLFPIGKPKKQRSKTEV